MSKDGENSSFLFFAGAGCTAQLTQLSLGVGWRGRSGPQIRGTSDKFQETAKNLQNQPNLIDKKRSSPTCFSFFLPTASAHCTVAVRRHPSLAGLCLWGSARAVRCRDPPAARSLSLINR